MPLVVDVIAYGHKQSKGDCKSGNCGFREHRVPRGGCVLGGASLASKYMEWKKLEENLCATCRKYGRS